MQTTATSLCRDDLGTLKGVTRLDLLPALDGTGLDAEHVFVAVVRGEVGDGGGLVGPGVPDDNVVEIVADDRVDGPAVLEDDDRGLRAGGGRVDSVRLGGDGDVAGLRLGGAGVNLVGVGSGVEALDCDFCDVLGVAGGLAFRAKKD